MRLPRNDGQDRLQKTLVGLRDFDFGSVADDLLAGLVLTIWFRSRSVLYQSLPRRFLEFFGNAGAMVSEV